MRIRIPSNSAVKVYPSGGVFSMIPGAGPVEVNKPGIKWLLRDEFTTALAAGSVNGTAAEPGPGVRNIADLDSRISITGGVFNIAANAGGTSGYGRTGLWLTPAIVRVAGQVIAYDYKWTVGSIGMSGITTIASAANTGYANCGVQFTSDPRFMIRKTSDATSPIVLIPPASTTLRIYNVLRAVGKYVFMKVAGVTKLLWSDAWDATGTLYFGLTDYSKTDALTLDNLAIYDTIRYQVIASSSDSFNRDDGVPGVTDGAGHAEANSGSGKTWVDSQGTGAISTNKLICSALDAGGKGIVTVNTGQKDEVITLNITRSAGQVGVVVRYVDSDNYIYAYHDGTNAALIQRLSGVESNIVAPTAATYAAGADIRVSCDGTTLWLYYNQLYIGSAASATAPVGTKHGYYTTDTGNSGDNWRTFPRGNNGEYADLGAR